MNTSISRARLEALNWAAVARYTQAVADGASGARLLAVTDALMAELTRNAVAYAGDKRPRRLPVYPDTAFAAEIARKRADRMYRPTPRLIQMRRAGLLDDLDYVLAHGYANGSEATHAA